MFDLSWSEITIILVLAILIIDPKDIPGIMKSVGKLIGKVKRVGKDFMSAIEDAAGEERINEFRNQIEREQQIISKAVDMNGDVQEQYDPSDIVDTSRQEKKDD